MCNEGRLYQPDQHVPRVQETDLQEWLYNDTNRIVSIVGSPGVGKSWLLQHLRAQELNHRVCLEFQASELIKNRYRETILRQVASQCRGDETLIFDQDQSLEACIEIAIAYICKWCNSPEPLIFIDGLDEIPANDLVKIETKALRPMIISIGSCVRLVIARREPLKYDSLRNVDRTIELSVFNPIDSLPDENIIGMIEDDSNLHLEKLHQQYTNVPADPTILEELTGTHAYQWNHPFINRFLFERLNEKIEQDLNNHLSMQDLEECCLELVNRPSLPSYVPTRVPVLENDDLEQLRRIACNMPEKWAIRDLRRVESINWSEDDLEKHFQRRIICQMPPHFQIVDGLRELLQDLDRLIR